MTTALLVMLGVVVGMYVWWFATQRPRECVVHPVTNLDWSYRETREDSGEVEQE